MERPSRLRENQPVSSGHQSRVDGGGELADRARGGLADERARGAVADERVLRVDAVGVAGRPPRASARR